MVLNQFLKQCDIECSSARLSRREWPRRTCNGVCENCCHSSDWAREMANSAAGGMASILTESLEKPSTPPPP
eukprot:7625141-Pyramimonas_sp.AAC.1